MTISTTPVLALPWPNNDEPVTNGWDAIRDLAVAAEAEILKRAEGLLARTLITADVAGGSAAADLTGYTVTTPSLAAGREIEVVARVHLLGNTSGDVHKVSILEGVTVLGEFYTDVSGTTMPSSLAPSVLLRPSSGVHTYKVQAARVSGAGSWVPKASATNPAYVAVKDLGAV